MINVLDISLKSVVCRLKMRLVHMIKKTHQVLGGIVMEVALVLVILCFNWHHHEGGFVCFVDVERERWRYLNQFVMSSRPSLVHHI